MKKILSISVAAYNIEKFIKQNIESFTCSEVREKIEVLVTDDGSKDNTPNIVKEYEKMYPGVIKLIQQTNAGPGSTINSGLKNATGKYFRMVDGDDWVKTENLEKYIELLETSDADMVITDYCTYNDQNGDIEKQKVQNIKEGTYKFNDVADKLKLPMHTITYKTEILKNNNIKFDNGFYTDVEYIIFPAPYINSIAYLDVEIYMYRIGLSTQSMNASSLQKNIHFHDTVLKKLISYYEEKKESVEDNKLTYMKNRIADMLGSHLAILLSYNPNKEHKNEVIDLFKYVKSNSKDLYKKFIKQKKAFALISSRYGFYKIISNLYRSNNGMK